MSKKLYTGVNNIARNVSKFYVGVNGVARKVTKAYVGVNGVARLFWDSSVPPTPTGLQINVHMYIDSWNGTGGQDISDVDFSSATIEAQSEKIWDYAYGAINSVVYFYDNNKSRSVARADYAGAIDSQFAVGIKGVCFTSGTELCIYSGSIMLWKISGIEFFANDKICFKICFEITQ